MGFGVWGLGFGVWGLGFGVWGLGFGVWGLGFGVWGLGFGVWGLGFGVWVLFLHGRGGGGEGRVGESSLTSKGGRLDRTPCANLFFLLSLLRATINIYIHSECYDSSNYSSYCSPISS